MATIKIELRPWQTPNFATAVMPPGRREDGLKEPPSYALSELDAADGDLCPSRPVLFKPFHSSSSFVEVIVNGQPVQIAPMPIRELIAAAIQKAGQIGAPIDQWVLKTREGDVIPHQLPGGLEYAVAGGQRVFLHLGLPAVPPRHVLEANIRALKARAAGVDAPHVGQKLEALIESWRHAAMVAGQASVEEQNVLLAEADSRTESAYRRCADELEAAVGPAPQPGDGRPPIVAPTETGPVGK